MRELRVEEEEIGCGREGTSLLRFEGTGTRLREAGLAMGKLGSLEMEDMEVGDGGLPEAKPAGGMATERGGAVEGSVYAPDVGAVMEAEPKRGSKELSMGSRLLHQRHMLDIRDRSPRGMRP